MYISLIFVRTYIDKIFLFYLDIEPKQIYIDIVLFWLIPYPISNKKLFE